MTVNPPAKLHVPIVVSVHVRVAVLALVNHSVMETALAHAKDVKIHV